MQLADQSLWTPAEVGLASLRHSGGCLLLDETPFILITAHQTLELEASLLSNHRAVTACTDSRHHPLLPSPCTLTISTLPGHRLTVFEM